MAIGDLKSEVASLQQQLSGEPYQDKLIADVRNKWDRFLEDHISVGMNESVADQALEGLYLAKSTYVVGGTGNYRVYYRIDDVHDVYLFCNKEGEITAAPFVIPHGQWVKEPSGDFYVVD